MLLFVDSFDHYATADILKKWNNSATASFYNIQSGGGRNSTQSFRISNSVLNPGIGKSVPSKPATLIVGFALQFSVGFSTNTDLLIFREGATTQVGVRITPSGTLIVHRNSTTLATSTLALNASVYNFLELKATINGSTGSYELRVNGATILSATNVNTLATSNAWVDAVWLGPINAGQGGGNIDFDDFYICDTTGSNNNDFLGDVRIECLQPSAAGTTTQFTPSTGANYTDVDEAIANTTDYVTSSADNQIDTYAFGDLSESAGTIKAVQVSAYAQKTDVGSRSIALIDRTNGTNHVGSDHALSTSYAIISDVLETDSGNGGVAWTIASVNGAEFGIKDRP